MVLYAVVGLLRLKTEICRSAVPITSRLSLVSMEDTLSGKVTVAIGFGSTILTLAHTSVGYTSEIPILESLIPTRRCQRLRPIHIDKLDTLDRQIMSRNLLILSTSQIKQLCRFVCTSRSQFCPVFGEMCTQDRGCMFVHGFAVCTALANLVDADFVVPGGDAEDFGGGGECEVGDGVFRALRDFEV